jgi:hypothetical protein
MTRNGVKGKFLKKKKGKRNDGGRQKKNKNVGTIYTKISA